MCAVRISISGEGLNFESEAPLVKAAQVIAFLGAPETEQNIELFQENSNALSSPSQKSLGELVSESNARTNAQKITLFASVLQSRGSESFSMDEVRNCFRKAGDRIPKNLQRDVRDAVHYNFIALADDGKYYLTQTGKNSVMTGFSSKAERSVRKSTSKKNIPQKLEIREDLEKTEVISKILEEIEIGYWDKTKTKGERILFLLYAADKISLDHLNRKEIEYLANKIKDRIEAKDISALTASFSKKHFIIGPDKEGAIKIRKPGIDYIVSLIKRQ